MKAINSLGVCQSARIFPIGKILLLSVASFYRTRFATRKPNMTEPPLNPRSTILTPIPHRDSQLVGASFRSGAFAIPEAPDLCSERTTLQQSNTRAPDQDYCERSRPLSHGRRPNKVHRGSDAVTARWTSTCLYDRANVPESIKITGLQQSRTLSEQFATII
jgi:hypothetical protein